MKDIIIITACGANDFFAWFTDSEHADVKNPNNETYGFSVRGTLEEILSDIKSSMQEKVFFDIDSGRIVTAEKLFSEYTENKRMRPAEYDYTFPEYIRNCLTKNGGTLEIIEK